MQSFCGYGNIMFQTVIGQSILCFTILNGNSRSLFLQKICDGLKVFHNPLPNINYEKGFSLLPLASPRFPWLLNLVYTHSIQKEMTRNSPSLSSNTCNSLTANL